MSLSTKDTLQEDFLIKWWNPYGKCYTKKCHSFREKARKFKKYLTIYGKTIYKKKLECFRIYPNFSCGHLGTKKQTISVGLKKGGWT